MKACCKHCSSEFDGDKTRVFCSRSCSAKHRCPTEDQESYRLERLRAVICGRKKSDEHKQKLSESIRRAHAEGRVRKCTPEQIANRIEASKMATTGKPRPQHVKDAVSRAQKLIEFTEERRERLRVAHLMAMKKIKGGHGFGRAEAGRIDHNAAKTWHIRDPSGRTYKFSNLCAWCRANEQFIADSVSDPWSGKLPLWRRAAAGIVQIGGRDGKQHWKGWTLVTKSEHRDPLARNQVE